MKSLIRRRPVVTFYALAFLLGFAFTAIRFTDPNAMVEAFQTITRENFHPNVFTTIAISVERPVLFTGYLFPFAPTLAALLIVLVGWGKPGFTALLGRMRPWCNGVTWRKGLLVYAMTVCVFLAFALLFVLDVQASGSPGALDRILDRYGGGAPFLAFAFLLVAPLLNHGALLEELGWRGYLQPIMLDRYAPLKAAVLIGILWGMWHLPRDIPGLLTYSDAFIVTHGGYFGFLVNQTIFVFGTIALSICIMYVVNLTGGSVLAAILIHGMANELSVALSLGTGVSYEFMGMSLSMTKWLVPLLAIVILAAAGPRLGYRREAMVSE